MKKTVFLWAIILSMIFESCGNVASNYKGYRVQLSSRDEVYAEFDMSIFRGIASAGMTYKEMVEIAGEPDEYDDSESSIEETLYNPVYYGQGGKLVVAWGGDNVNERIGLLKFIPFDNEPFYLSEFVHNPETLGITSEMDDFAVYVDDILYFIVHLKNGRITKISYWLVREK